MLVLVDLALHVRVGVGVDVCVNLWVHLGCHGWGQSRPLGQQMLLLGNVFLIVYGGDAVFVGDLGDTDPVPGLLPVHGGSSWRGAGLLLALAKPQEYCPKDEDSSGRDTDDHWPGQAAGRGRGHRCTWRLGV